MFKVFFLHFSEVTLQAFLIWTTSKLLQCTKHTLNDTLNDSLNDTLNDTLNQTLHHTFNHTFNHVSKQTSYQISKQTSKHKPVSCVPNVLASGT